MNHNPHMKGIRIPNFLTPAALATSICLVMVAMVCLSGCSSQPVPTNADSFPSDPSHHEVYGISYEMPDTHWTYMFNADKLGTGDEYINLDISSVEEDIGLEAYWKRERTGKQDENSGENSVLKDSGKISIDGRDCYWYDKLDNLNATPEWTKDLLIPKTDGNSFIEIKCDFIDTNDKAKADKLFKGFTKGITFSEDKGYILTKDYLSVGGIWIPMESLQPVQFFYGLMDFTESDGMISGQIHFDSDAYPKDVEQAFSDASWSKDDLRDDGTITLAGTRGKWFTSFDEGCSDALPYLDLHVWVPSEDAQALISFTYNFDGSVDDLDQYEDQFEELRNQIHETETVN